MTSLCGVVQSAIQSARRLLKCGCIWASVENDCEGHGCSIQKWLSANIGSISWIHDIHQFVLTQGVFVSCARVLILILTTSSHQCVSIYAQNTSLSCGFFLVLFTLVCSELPTIGFLQGPTFMSFRVSFSSGIVLNSSFRFFQIQAHAFHEEGDSRWSLTII